MRPSSAFSLAVRNYVLRYMRIYGMAVRLTSRHAPPTCRRPRAADYSVDTHGIGHPFPPGVQRRPARRSLGLGEERAGEQ